MPTENVLQFLPTFVLAFFRLSGLMISSPLFGSSRIPKRMKILFASIATVGMMGAIKEPVQFPDTLWALTIGIGGELVFGLAMGMMVSFTFIASQWAGEMIGQQMGFNLSEVFDPQFGQAGTLIGDLYFMLTLVVFLLIGGHRQMMHAVYDSFSSTPLLSVAFSDNLFQSVISMLTSTTILALRLAAPMFFTMLVVDLSMGVISRAMPQFNVMSAGLSLRAILGVVVLLVGIGLTSTALTDSLSASLNDFVNYWRSGVTSG
jgi:flagellar biosynthetic protein FliR